MDMLIDPSTRDYTGESISTLANAVYLRLMVPLGSWWADATLGSRLHELAREKDVSRVYTLARQYCEQALQSLIDDGRATAISVTSSRMKPGWLLLHIVVEIAPNQSQTFNHPVRVA
ncbi:phage GP46 family protein [Yersinia massiliensis]|uniref:phage GP46 family protein n=1 Tax=Yersinia massiliensis TaxID=419257 RepID=UPI001CFF26D6|nr:phage GP46 family protein [Yersinia massiliensis]MCB5309205.1 phage GP46 family protein [Yersinia massiliensis]